MATTDNAYYLDLAEKIKCWGKELGFADVGFSDVDLSEQTPHFLNWLANHYHGNMQYMANHGLMRTQPDELLPGTLCSISVRMNYLPANAKFAKVLKNKQHAYISRYALGRDYHKLMRNQLQKLGEKIKLHITDQPPEHENLPVNFRPFVDSAPILERPLAEKAGLGWVGKHSLVINPDAGSWFFLGELLINLPLANLPITTPIENKCGNCVACLKICPTGAIVAPYVVDARRCISYLTIELRDAIPEEFRSLIGNRIYGCDDCQLVCPWNKYGQLSKQDDFQARENLDDLPLLTLFAWNEATFLQKLQGSPIRRIGHECWQRNIAVALGNANYSPEITAALQEKLSDLEYPISEMVREHVEWALLQQQNKQATAIENDADTVAQKTNQTSKNAIERLSGRLIRAIEKGLPRDA